MIGLGTLTLLVATLLPAQQVEPVLGTGSATPVTFDWSGLDVNGDPEVVAKVRFRFFRLDIAPPPEFGLERVVNLRITAPGSYSVLARDVFQTGSIPSGRWEMKIRLEDEAGNISVYSDPLIVRLDSGKPSAPTNVGVGGS